MDDPTNDPDETPMQRALRLKKAAVEARQKGRGGAKVLKGSAAMPAGQSKPWTRR